MPLLQYDTRCSSVQETGPAATQLAVESQPRMTFTRGTFGENTQKQRFSLTDDSDANTIQGYLQRTSTEGSGSLQNEAININGIGPGFSSQTSKEISSNEDSLECSTPIIAENETHDTPHILQEVNQ